MAFARPFGHYINLFILTLHLYLSSLQAHDSWGTKPRASLRPRSDMAVVNAAAAPKSHSESLASRSEAVAMDSANKSTKSRPSIPDIDAADKHDPLAATDFVQDIFAYYKRVEPKVRVSPNYMAHQVDINDKMRAILIDWLVDVHLKFKLMPETLYLTTNLIDRFLEHKQVTRKHLQLVSANNTTTNYLFLTLYTA